jgi:ligand-binding sensor domain-containing protein
MTRAEKSGKNSGLFFWLAVILIGISFYFINERENPQTSLSTGGSLPGNRSDTTTPDSDTAQAPKRISDKNDPLGKISVPLSRIIKTAPVNDMLVDPRGSLWAATESGITSVYADKVAYFSINEGSFPFSQAECLAHDGKQLWVGTLFGLCHKTENDRFIRSEESSSLPSQLVYSLTWDGNALWAGTQSGTAFKAPSGLFHTINEQNSNGGLRNNRCHKVARFASWLAVAHDKGLSFWNTSFQASNPEWWKNIDHVRAGITRPITGIAFDGRNLWIATSRGVLLLTTPLDKFFSESVSNLTSYSQIHGLPANRVNTLIAHKGSIWLGTDEGLARIKDERIQIVHDETNNSPQRIRKLTASGDILWIGSDRGIQFINTAMVD